MTFGDDFGAFARQLDQNGRLPTIGLEIYPLDGGEPKRLTNFTSYQFSSNMVVPVDTFSFAFKPPLNEDRAKNRIDKIVQEGDTVQLTLGKKPVALSTGFVDQVAIDFNYDDGPIVRVSGRDLMGFLEDNEAVNPDSSIIYFASIDPNGIAKKLIEGTRIKGVQLKNLDDTERTTVDVATFPGESRLAVLQRFCTPINSIAWMSPTGYMNIGRPSFQAPTSGTLGIRSLVGSNNLRGRTSNNIRCSVVRNSTRIANAYLSIWSGLETVQSQISQRSFLLNKAKGPSRLYQRGHKVFRTIVTSRPDATDRKDGLTQLNILNAAGANFLDALANREAARDNMGELIVTMTVPGHINPAGDPYVVDQVYDVVVDQAGVEEKMLLYSVDYSLQEDGGQMTTLSFCKLNTIVATGNVLERPV